MRFSISLRNQGIVLLGLLVGLGLSFVVTFVGMGSAIAAQQNGAAAGRQTEIDALRLETGMINQETGVRGYRLTGSQDFLGPYALGRSQVVAAKAALDAATTGATAHGRLLNMETGAQSWQTWAEGQTALIDTSGAFLNPVASDEGKRLFDAFRVASGAFQTSLRADVQGSDANARTQSTVSQVVLGLIVLAGLVVLGLFSTRFFMGTLRPITSLVNAAGLLATGVPAVIPVTGRRDEVGRLSDALRAWEGAMTARLGLARAMVEVSSEVQLETVLDRSVKHVRAALVAAEVFVQLHSPEGPKIYTSVADFDPAHADDLSPATEAFTTESRVVTDLRDPRWSDALTAWARGRNLGPVLSVPMVSVGETIGVVSFVRTGDQPPFGPADLVIADIVVPAIAAGVRVSQLFADLHEANAKMARASQVKSEFLANMSHELRTPLNAILGFSELLIDAKEGSFDAGTRAEFLKTINTSGQHLLGLINDILDLAKIESGRLDVRLESLDFANAVEETLDALASLALTKDIRLVSDAASPLEIVADPRLVRQILVNLVSNAIKFNPNGGTVTVAAAKTETELVFSVTDTGIGIEAEDQERIFGEFEQINSGYNRSQQGTGLGLALTRRMLALQGGRIWVESAPGQGATFRAVLPLKPAEMLPAAPRLQSESPDGPLILVIEDDASAASLVGHQLAAGGFRSVVAKDGRQALELARTLNPVAITLDVILPEMDGWEVLRTLKVDNATRDIPVVVISVLDDKVSGRALGAADYFVKPVEPQALLAGLARYGLGAGNPQRVAKVLVVDDEPNVHDLMARVLQPDQFTMVRALSGAEALEKAREEHPDAILLDLVMAEMSGFEVIAALRGDPATAGIPILVVTAKDLSEAEKLRLNGSVAAVMAKSSLAAVDIVSWLRQTLSVGAVR